MMKYYKLKTIGIAAFAVCILIGLYCLLFSFSPPKLTAQNKETVIQILAKQNISVSPSLIPENKTYLSGAVVKNGIQDKTEFAKRFLGNDFQQVSGNLDFYLKENEQLLFHANTFSYQIQSPAASQELSTLTVDNAARKSREIMERFQLNISNSIIKVEKNEQMFFVSMTKTIDDLPVFNDTVTLSLSTSGLYNISGTWFEDRHNHTVFERRVPAKNPLSILLDFSRLPQRPKSAEISNITLGYLLAIEEDEYQPEVILKPVWRLTLKSGETYDFPA